MTSGDDDKIRGKTKIHLGKLLIAHGQHPVRLRKTLPVCKFQPVIHHREGEIQRFQHFFEGQGNMPATEDHDLRPAGKLFFKKGTLSQLFKGMTAFFQVCPDLYRLSVLKFPGKLQIKFPPFQ